MSGPLAGVTVLELAQVYAVPAAGTLLADMGANVVKVEPPWGDSTRYGRPLLPGEGRNYIGLNHSKRSICVDLAREEARPLVEALIRQSDVVLVSLRVDQMKKYGVTYEAVKAIRPDVIYLSNTAAGPEGPLAGLGGYDVNITSLAGIGASQGYVRNNQLVNATGLAISDAGTSFVIAAAVSAALYHRLRTGEGQRIETSNLSTALNCQLQSLNEFAVDAPVHQELERELTRLRAEGATFEEMQAARERITGRGGRGGSVYYRIYRTKDSYISIGAISPHLAVRLREATGVEDPRQRPGFDPTNAEHQRELEQLVARFEEAFVTRTTDEWVEILVAKGVPHGRVNFPEEALNDAQVAANGYVVEVEHEVVGTYRTPAPPMTMSATPVEIRSPAPSLDEHTDEVFADLGIDQATIAHLRSTGVIGRAAELLEDYH